MTVSRKQLWCLADLVTRGARFWVSNFYSRYWEEGRTQFIQNPFRLIFA
jgi:hypothetical protein